MSSLHETAFSLADRLHETIKERVPADVLKVINIVDALHVQALLDDDELPDTIAEATQLLAGLAGA